MLTPTKRQQLATLTAAVVAATTVTGLATTSAGATDRPTRATAYDAQAAPDTQRTDRQRLRSTLKRDARRLLRQGPPGILVRLDTPRGKVRVRAGYGNLKRQTPVPWNARFRIGSMTKPFVAATVLKLVGDGRLSLEDTVDRWLPGVVSGNGNDGRKITVRQLLQHTSGLPDYVAFAPVAQGLQGFQRHRFDTVTAPQAVRWAMRAKPTFAPGTDWSYSNTNYALAGMVIEKAAGRPWRAVVRDRILRPLDLRHTTLPRTSPRIPRPHARGYERFPGPGATPENPKYGRQIDATLQNLSWGGAAGEIISTGKDGNRFLRALVSGKLLRPRLLAQMQRTVPTGGAFEQFFPGGRYGLGLMWIPNSCGGSWSHGGDVMGFMTRNGVTPDGRRSVMVSYNTDSPKRKPGVPAPKHEMTRTLIDHALCGPRR